MHQIDLAGNISLDSSTVTWNFDPLSIDPVIIASPLSTDFTTASNTLLVSGSCDEGLTVSISGISSSEVTSPAGQLDQICSENLDFAFTLQKAAAGTSNIDVVQTNGITSSSATSFVWRFDNIAPSLTIATMPANPNYFSNTTFTFSSNDPLATIECSLDGQPYTTCTSGYTNSALSNGTHTLNARATDAVGNTSAIASHTWVQNSYKTLALYHFSQGSELVDSSLYTDATLTNSGTTSGTGNFGEGRVLAANQSLSSANHPQFQAATNEFTVEAWIKMSTLPSNGTWQTIVSKTTSASAGMSFVFQIGRTSNKNKLRVQLSGNGSSISTYTTGGLTIATNTWHHVAITFKDGAYKIFHNGVSKKAGNASMTSVHSGTSNLRLGTDGTNQFVGEMDEVRYSQFQRYNVNFSPPTSPFAAD